VIVWITIRLCDGFLRTMEAIDVTFLSFCFRPAIE
jgi:hypothetical protein